MWARVKGKTENDLMKLNFKRVYHFRPGGLIPMPGAKNVLKMYSYLGWLVWLMKALAPGSVCKLEDLGNSMVNVVSKGYSRNIIEVTDMIGLAKA